MADDLMKGQLSENSRQKITVRIIQQICDKREANIKKLDSVSRRRFFSEARRFITCLVKGYEIPLSEVIRYFGVSTLAVFKMIVSEVIQFNTFKNVFKFQYAFLVSDYRFSMSADSVALRKE